MTGFPFVIHEIQKSLLVGGKCKSLTLRAACPVLSQLQLTLAAQSLATLSVSQWWMVTCQAYWVLVAVVSSSGGRGGASLPVATALT